MRAGLLEKLAAELERPRELTPKVINYVSGTYGVDLDEVGAFLVDELFKLEDYEVDLILSPLFTPKLADQSAIAEFLGGESVSSEHVTELISQLEKRPTRAHVTSPDTSIHIFNMCTVTIDRYVRRLRLEGRISDSVLSLANQVSSAAPETRQTLLAIARRAAWESAGAQEILARYLTNAPSRGGYALADAIDLLNLVEGRKPSDLADLLSRIAGWQNSLREQVEASGGRPFFHEDIRTMHGGGRDQRTEADPRMSAKERELNFLLRLERLLT